MNRNLLSPEADPIVLSPDYRNMSFPEEPLDSPAGYFAARTGQQLHDGKWTIVRKLGWGPRSSTWLAVNSDSDHYVALKIFTASATQDSSALNELKFLYLVQDLSSNNINEIIQHFDEQSSHGKHLCIALRPLNVSVETLRRSNSTEGEYLPLHIVQKIVADILPGLSALKKKGIIHGGILPDNFLLWALEAAQNITPEIAKNPCHEMVEVTGSDGKVYSTLTSQPLPPHFEWNDTRDDFGNANIYLSNFSHARHVDSEAAPFRSPANLLPPEVLNGGKVGSPVDIWMLGCAAYLLATGTPLFGDSYVSSPLTVVEETLPKLEELLTQNGKVSAADIPAFTTFLRACLVGDPGNRATVADLFDNEWVERGMMCSCGWCASDSPL